MLFLLTVVAVAFIAGGTATITGLAIAGVLAGTLYGERVLRRLPEDRFRRIVSGFLVVLGLGLLLSGAPGP